MYCPKCGQEIVSDELRFCPRCGLALTGVAAFLTDGLPVPQATEPKGLRIFRRKEYRLGAQLLFFSIIAIPVSIILSIAFDSPGPLAIPFLMFVAGLAMTSYTFLFGRKLSTLEARERNQILYSNPGMLDEPRVYVSPIDIPRLTTNELVRPPSVTEKTTTLLKENS